MLSLIGMTLPTTTRTRLFRKQGALANICRYKTGHHYRHRDETLPTTTSTKMLVYQQQQQLWYANGDNGNNWWKIYIIIQSYRFKKITTKNEGLEKPYQNFFVLNIISFLTNIESVHLLLFLITTFSLIFKNKEKLIKFFQHFIICCYFFETVILKNYVNLLSIISIFTVGIQ